MREDVPVRELSEADEEVWFNRALAAAVPTHIGFIMDGNGRWAQQRGLPRTEGHMAGVEALRGIIPALTRLRIPYATFFAFSTENWRRPQEEVRFLFDLLVRYSMEDVRELRRQGVRMRAIGDTGALPAPVREAIARIESETADGTSLVVNVALNYGGRREIVDAARAVFKGVVEGRLEIEDLTEEVFSRFLYTAGQPDPDLIIRTSGEQRLSNFMLWQGAYSELYFTEVLWPDFRPLHLYQAVVHYAGRRRRYGGLEG